MPIVELLDRIAPERAKPLGDKIYHWFDFQRRVLNGTSGIFSHIEIGTIDGCNRSCEVCPTTLNPRPNGLMGEGLFRKIIDELGEIGFRGKIHPHFYGEPLLDERLPEFIGYARTVLPKSQIVIWTNGDLLTKKLLEELVMKGVDRFIVSRYNENGQLSELGPAQRKRVRYKQFSDNTYLFNRGGLVKPRHVRQLGNCYYPSNVVVVDCQGNVVLCCNDYKSKYIFGNLKSERLMDVWDKNGYSEARENLRRGDFNLEICRICSGK